MKIVLLTPFLFALLACKPNSAASETRVVGGQEASGYIPSVSLFLPGSQAHHCGAIPIGRRVLVTAAHCIFTDNPSDPTLRQDDRSNIQVAFGPDHQRLNGITAIKSAIHPDFTLKYSLPMADQSSRSDVGLIVLNQDLPESIKIASIGSPEMTANGSEVELWGLGKFSSNQENQSLQYHHVRTTIQKHGTDGKEFGFNVQNGKGSCNGDSGFGAYRVENSSYVALGVVSRSKDDDACEKGLGLVANITKFRGFIACAVDLMDAGDQGPRNLKADGSSKACQNLTTTESEQARFLSQNSVNPEYLGMSPNGTLPSRVPSVPVHSRLPDASQPEVSLPSECRKILDSLTALTDSIKNASQSQFVEIDQRAVALHREFNDRCRKYFL